MEYHFSSFLVLPSFILFLFLVLKIGKGSKSKLPPGPWKLPVIGNLHQLVNSSPHQAMRDMAKKHGALMYLRIGQLPFLIVTSAECAEEVMKTHDIVFTSRPYTYASDIIAYGSTGIGASPCGQYWRQVRKISIQDFFNTKRLNSCRAIREAAMLDLINWISSKAQGGSSLPINLTSKLRTSTHILVSKIAFGKECTENEEFRSANERLLRVVSGSIIVDAFPSMKWLHWLLGVRSKLEKIHQERDAVLSSIITQHIDRKLQPEDHEDLVDVLLKFYGHGDDRQRFQLTLDNIKAIMSDIIIGGTETSSITVDWAMAEMMKNPEIMQKAQAEVRQVFNSMGNADETGIPQLKYLKLVIKETLRLHPPAPLLLPRENEKVCEIKGYEIPAKTQFLVNAWAIGRDPRYWNEPERFYPERFEESHLNFSGTNFEFIPFGAGRRMCPGITFALANIELLLSQLLYYFDWKLPNEMKHEDLQMFEISGGLTVGRRDDLYLIPTPYQPVSKP